MIEDTTGSKLLDLKRDVDAYNRLTPNEKLRLDCQVNSNCQYGDTDREDIERRKLAYLKGHKKQIAAVIKQRSMRIERERLKAERRGL